MCHPRVVPVERASRRTGTVLSDCVVELASRRDVLGRRDSRSRACT